MSGVFLPDVSAGSGTWMDRAGASDSDREAWLAQRRQGITATEIRDLAKAQNLDLAIARLVEVKRRPEEPWAGNAYTEWGKLREEAISEWAFGSLVLLPESRVFWAAVNPRYLASPDGVDSDGQMIGEYKTCSETVAPEEMVDRYGDQCQWQMMVIGAGSCCLAWEERLGEPGAFRPGDIDWVMLTPDSERIAFLRSIADRFLAALDAEPEPEDEVLSHLVADYLGTKAMARMADEALRGYLDGAGITASKTDGWSLSYAPGKPRRTLDQKRLTADHPELVDEYMSEGKPGAPSLRITQTK